MPKNSFTEEELNEEWTTFLKEIRNKDHLTFNAISGFKVSKIDNENIHISYPSSTAKKEFEKVSGQFLQQLKTKLDNYAITIQYSKDIKSMKKEVITKKKMFQDLCKKNPLLNELNDFFKFDLN